MIIATAAQYLEIGNILRDTEVKISEILKTNVSVTLMQRISKDTEIIEGRDTFVANLFYSVEKHLGVTKEEIKSRSRTLHISQARNIFVKILRESKYRPHLSAIGSIIKRHHSTIIHSIQTVNNDIEQSVIVRAAYNSILSELN
jgi:chromosomal replication initiation ATPase DnaA